MKNNKGYSLVELVIVLGVAGVLILAIASFFINSTNNYSRIGNNAELQYQAQFVSNFIEEKAMVGTGIIYIENENGFDISNSSGKNSIGKFVIDNLTEGDIFEIKNGNEIFYGVDSIGNVDYSTTNELGKFISRINITGLPEGTSYREANSIEIEYIFAKDNQTINIVKKIYFRNFSN